MFILFAFIILLEFDSILSVTTKLVFELTVFPMVAPLLINHVSSSLFRFPVNTIVTPE